MGLLSFPMLLLLLSNSGLFVLEPYLQAKQRVKIPFDKLHIALHTMTSIPSVLRPNMYTERDSKKKKKTDLGWTYLEEGRVAIKKVIEENRVGKPPQIAVLGSVRVQVCRGSASFKYPSNHRVFELFEYRNFSWGTP